MSIPIAFCWSGGKDSALALADLQSNSPHQVVQLVTTLAQDVDRVMMHGVRRELIELQAAALGLPLREVRVPAFPSNEKYEAAMGAAFDELRAGGIEAIGFGDIFLEDLRAYRERLLEQHGLRGVYPLWKRPSSELVQRFLSGGYRAKVCCVDERVLAAENAGRELDESFWRDLPSGIGACGENGEFHSFVHAGPIFSHSIPCHAGEKVTRHPFVYCDLMPSEPARASHRAAI